MAIQHYLLVGQWQAVCRKAVEVALVWHTPDYESDCRRRTRITLLTESVEDIYDLVFEYQELFDNSYWRIVDLGGEAPRIEQHRPQYLGRRKDFVDVEWEFVLGHLSNPLLQSKMRRWTADPRQRLALWVDYGDEARNRSRAEKLRRRLSVDVAVESPAADACDSADHMDMARYLNYCYGYIFEHGTVPNELPEDEVEKAWRKLTDDKMRMSNIYSVMAIPVKMRILGHDRGDWDKFYALTADEIEQLTAVEHNRWCVERLVQGFRPCTDEERAEIEEDMRRRLGDESYRQANPVSLKVRYKNERLAHYDLCAFSELGVDETGLPVSRYDRDLTAAIPLIVKTFNDRHGNG